MIGQHEKPAAIICYWLETNQLPTDEFESIVGLIQLVNEPTRNKAILDKIFIDSVLASIYCEPIIGPNFGKADHVCTGNDKAEFCLTSLIEIRQTL